MPIFDQGYQHFQGQLTSQAWRWTVITRHGVRNQLRNRTVRMLMLVAWMPAIALVTFLAIWGLVEQKSEGLTMFLSRILPPGAVADPVAHRSAVWTIAYSYFFSIELFVIMLLVAAVGPGLISRDLRFNALPLYFSRPIRRFDYFLGKLGVIGFLVAAVAVAPALLAYVLGVCFSLDLTVVRDTWRLLLASIAYGLVIVLSLGTIMLALSSLTRRSLIVGIAWFGIWVIGGSVASTLAMIQASTVARETAVAATLEEPAAVADPVLVVDPVADDDRDEEARAPARAEEQMRHIHAQERRFDEMQAKRQEKMAEARRNDWRPLFSIPSNLQRIGDALLGSDAAWVALGRVISRPRQFAGGYDGEVVTSTNERYLADFMVLQYPWGWSAGVLLGLGALSVFILTSRVKSLDRLK